MTSQSVTPVLTPVSVCHSWPETLPAEIVRDNILDTLETQLAGETRLIAVEGDDGAGKTTLLTQLAGRHATRTISLFISSWSRWAYDPGQLRYDLCNQLEVVLHSRELESISEASEQLLQTLVAELRRRARRRGEVYYFVVDGMEEIPEEDSTSRRLILELLPIGFSRLRFLFSGHLATLGLNPSAIGRAKSFPLPFFTLDESLRYLRGLGLEKEQIEDLHRSCRGMPGFLASVRRLVETGITAEEVMAELPRRLPEIFEIEWRKLGADERRVELVAMIAHAPRRYSIDGLARVTSTGPDQVRALLADLTFVITDAQHAQEVRFVSEAFRRFAADRLRGWKTRVHDRFIDDLLADPETEEAITYLPTHFREANRLEELLNYLSPEHFARVLEVSPTERAVQQKAELGILTSRELNREGDIVRFTLHKATISEILESDVGRSRVLALAALGDLRSAIALAQGATRQEDRLHLLAVVARARKEQGLPPDPELNEHITELYASLDYTSLGRRAEAIAADLVHSRMDLAIDLVSRAAGDDPTENRLDWAFARLAVEAMSGRGAQAQHAETVQELTGRIKNPLVRRVSAEVVLILGGSTAQDAIAQAMRFEAAGDRLYVLRQWMRANRKRADADAVLQHAVTLAIQATGYSPNATVFRELAICLPYMEDLSKARHWAGVLDTQLGIIERTGPTEDFVRLLLIIARTEYRYDTPAALSRLVSIYLTVDGLKDLATKAACMARLVAAVRRLDPGREFEKGYELHSLAAKDLSRYVGELLSWTADHHRMAGPIVRALAGARPDLAMEIAGRLNTEGRRDAAMADLVTAVVEGPLDEVNVRTLVGALEGIAEPRRRDIALAEALSILTQRGWPAGRRAELVPLVARISQIQDPEDRAASSAVALAFISNFDDAPSQEWRRQLATTLADSWETLDAPWEKVEVGFKIIAQLTHDMPALAREYLQRVTAFERSNDLCEEEAATSAQLSVRLAIRAFAGLLIRRLNTPEDAERISRAIQRIPAIRDQVELFTDLAARYYLAERGEECARIVSDEIAPRLRALSERGYPGGPAFIVAAPVLYVAAPASTQERLADLSRHERDRALSRICHFLLRGTPPDDPYDSAGEEGFDISYETVAKLCQLMERMDSDGLIYSIVESIVESVVHSRSREKFSRPQRAEIGRLLSRVIEAKLPAPGHIAHEGYKIIAQAQIRRIIQDQPISWDMLSERARAIPNSADRAFVLAVIGVTQRDTRVRSLLLKEARDIIERIPTLGDKIDRYEFLASLLVDVDVGMSKELLRLAFDYTKVGDPDELGSSRRSLVDLAYRIDPEFAEHLASELNDDPATQRLKRRVRVLNLRRELATRGPRDAEGTSTAEDYSQAAWLRLASLNAGRSEALRMERTLPYLEYAHQPISVSYPLFAWLIENAVRRHGPTDAARRFVLPLYEAALLGAELAIRVASRSSRQTERALRLIEVRPHAETVVLGPGERDSALGAVKDWMERHLGRYLKLSDPYFGPSDLSLLRLVQQVRPECEVQVLTSRKHHLDRQVPQPWEQAYAMGWRAVSDDEPPVTEIVIAGVRGTSDSPVHDRWLITEGSGMDLGTSWNALGTSRVSAMRTMDSEEAAIKERELDRFLVQKAAAFRGTRVSYETVLLGDN